MAPHCCSTAATGRFVSLQELAPEARLDAIFVSHAHADHVADLEAFMSSTEIWRERPRLLASEETMASIVRAPVELVDDILVVVRVGVERTWPTL